MTKQLDLGDEVLLAIRKRMQIDDQWATEIPGGFKWWGWNTAQTLWSEGPFDEEGFEVFRLHAYADVCSGFEESKEHLMMLKLLGSTLTMSGFIRDPDDLSRLGIASTMYVHEQNRHWVEDMFANVVAIQAAEASIIANHMPDFCPFTPNFSEHPISGMRDQQDDMLDIISMVINPAGQADSTWVGPDLVACKTMLQQPPCVMVTGEKTGLSAEFPFPDRTSLLRFDTSQENPRVGNGLLCLFNLPVGELDEDTLGLALQLNETEVTRHTRCHFLGSWTASDHGLAYASFFPNLLYQDGLAKTLCVNSMLRAKWVTEEIFKHSWEENFEQAMKKKTEQFAQFAEALGNDSSEDLPYQCQASFAIDATKEAVRQSNHEVSLDDYVTILREQPGASGIEDLKPMVVIVKFEDGSGVGVNEKGLDLLKPN